MLPLQYFKLKRNCHESAQEWMGRLQTKAAGCDYNEYGRKITEQFIHSLDSEGVINEILKEVSALENIDDTTGE